MDRGEVELQTGPFGTQLHASDYVESGTPMINARNIGFGEIRTEKLEYLSDETVKRLSSHLLKTNDLVFGRKGTVDRHVLILPAQDGWFQGTDCLRIRFNSKSINPQFVSYTFLTNYHKQWMNNQSSHGATMTSLNQGIISRIPLNLPDIPTQNKIATVLSAYDNLIENNIQRIKVLEEMAQALYLEWFVNFRFPGHEGVRMVESELGPVPEGWEVLPFSQALTLQRGFDLTSADRQDGSVPIYGSIGLSGYHNIAKVKAPGIVTGRSGTLGLVHYIERDFWPHNTALWVKEFKKVTPLFTLFLLRAMDLKQYNGGVAVPTLDRNVVHRVPVIIPERKLIENFEEIVKPLFPLISNLEQKNANLRRTRDLLLPKLISGEIDVSELDIRIPEAEA